LNGVGSRITPIPDDVAEALARGAARLGPFHNRISWVEEIHSTNDVAMGLAERGEPEGCVVVANAQTAGRGRLGRSWVSPAGAGLYVSAILRPRPEAISLITIAAGVAIAEGIHAASGLTPRLKWPNDVYVGERKLAGILAEGGTAQSSMSYVVLGFGINLFATPYPADVATRATSIELELGRPPDRGLVLVECLTSLASRYEALRRGDVGDITAAWRARAAESLGRAVEWDVDGRTGHGIAHDIDEAGALLVRTEDGQARVISGEVRWRS